MRNRGELAEGWYDPATLQKAQASATSEDNEDRARKRRRPSPNYNSMKGESEVSDEDEVGPAPLAQSHEAHQKMSRSGPAIPNMQDLEMQRGRCLGRSTSYRTITDLLPEQVLEDRFAQREDLRYDRRIHRKQQKEHLDELVPRAEAGSKDRLLEKKREKADSYRAFAAGKTEAGGVDEVPESDLLGDEDGGIEGLKKRKGELERKKNEREVRKDEILRARAEEREERVRAYREKEEQTMGGLIALAKARFG